MRLHRYVDSASETRRLKSVGKCLTLVVLLIAPVAALAQRCKPDVSTRDKITKQQIDEWAQGLYQSSVLAAALTTTSEVNISGTIGRFGNENHLNVIITKQESNLGRALFESAYKAVKGNEFLLGFKGGDPVKFTADEVRNKTAADMFGKLITTVILTSHIKDKDLLGLKESLTSNPVDAVRMVLANDLTIEQSVKEKNGRQFQEKLSCFFEFAREKGYITAQGAAGNDKVTKVIVAANEKAAQGVGTPPPTGTSGTPLLLGIRSVQIEIPEATKVRVRLEQPLTSATAEERQPVQLSVTDDILIDGVIVIPQNSVVNGTIVEVVPKRRMGRTGKLDFSIDAIVSPDGGKIPLRYGPIKKEGGSHAVRSGVITAGVAVLFWPAAPFMLLMKGKETTFNKGMVFEVFTDAKYSLKAGAQQAGVRAPAGRATERPLEVPPPPPPPPLAAEPPPPPKTIEQGQTGEQVIAAFGQPARIVKLGAKVIYFYKDLKVTLTNGKVSNVE